MDDFAGRESRPKSVAVIVGRALFALLAFLAAGVAWFNLLGVPMVERQLMNRTVGWTALAIAALCVVGAFRLGSGL